MVQVEQHTDAALAIVGEEHRALEHFDWREAVGAKRYGPSCHSRLEVHLLHHSVLLEKRVHDLSMTLSWTGATHQRRHRRALRGETLSFRFVGGFLIVVVSVS